MKTIYVLVVSLVFSMVAHAELLIEITQGVDNPMPVAISPFSWSGKESLPEKVSDIIQADLMRSGLFDLLAKENMLSHPDTEKEVFYRDWRALGRDYLVIGAINPVGESYEVKYYLFDVINQKTIDNYIIKVSKTGLRDMAHAISDRVFEKITNIRGAYSTKMIYLSRTTLSRGKYNFQLFLADSDGARAQKLVDSNEPILSPAWSADGKQIAYSKFVDGHPAIYRHVLATGFTEKLTNFKGINSSPSWSPDGKQLAMVLSKDGSPDIYIMNLETKRYLKIAPNDLSIDTEPSWMPDGQSIVFTSNRGGKPQIYQVEVESGFVKRLSFDGDYNARPRPIPDGSGIIMVHRQDGEFKIARLDLKRNQTFVLTNTQLDESPSIAANGSMVLYAAKQDDHGILAAVSIDGRVRFNLPSQGRDVREPAWSPFLN